MMTEDQASELAQTEPNLTETNPPEPEGILEQAAAPLEAVAEEIRAQTYSEEHPLGPFKAPESVEIAQIRENVGYVPRWLIFLFIMAILLALVLWIRPGGPLS